MEVINQFHASPVLTLGAKHCTQWLGDQGAVDVKEVHACSAAGSRTPIALSLIL